MDPRHPEGSGEGAGPAPDSPRLAPDGAADAFFTPCLHGFPPTRRSAAVGPPPETGGGEGEAQAVPPRWLEGRDGPLPAVNDEEGLRLPTALPPVIDAHVHLFPDRVFEAIWRWFDQHGWPIRYRLQAPGVIDFLLGRGVEQVIALHYSHTPGMARSLNHFIAGLTLDHPRVHGLATVLPGEPDAPQILAEAFELGLKGVKLHCHVQRFSPDDPHLAELYAVCEAYDRPLVMHAGREPSSAAYGVDTYALCNVERTARVLRDFPRLKLCIPHLGADEFEGYGRLLERHDTLWLDTTMALAGYFPVDPPRRLLEIRPDRILYGTDFPNLPYAWDREVRRIIGWRLPEADLAAMLGENARALYDLPDTHALAAR
ncbi:MAG TPA: amidohydrolase family protein [Myxococcaceae bacterium]|nr:amidohydrolase family protein [Myxococcaceae bacterium]